MDELRVECLLQVGGDTAALNTFDKQFRGGAGPQWADRPHNKTPRYSLHGLHPVPEDVQHRGWQTAGHLWCRDYWDTPDDVVQMQVKRLLGERRYRFFTQEDPPKNVFWKASANFQMLRFRLILLGKDGSELQIHDFHGGYYQGSYRPHAGGEFISLRGEMGFAA